MPKELIYPGSPQYCETRIEVGWARGQEVQIGITKRTNPEIFIAGAQQVRIANVDLVDKWIGSVMNLDRAQINGLIRTLRRARDQAFGRDE